MGLKISRDLEIPTAIPEPDHPLRGFEHGAWRKGYMTGFRTGASDAELASVDVPGAHGMISGFTDQFLEQFGFFAKEG